MNVSAAQLGMRHTIYTDPSGLDPSTVSTAADQLRLARAAMRIPAFAEIVGMPAAVIPVAGEVTNTDDLLGRDGFVGIKTGSDHVGRRLLHVRVDTASPRPRSANYGVVLGQMRGSLDPSRPGRRRRTRPHLQPSSAITTNCEVQCTHGLSWVISVVTAGAELFAASVRSIAVPDPIFAEPRLAAIYDALEPERADLVHYVAMVREFGSRSVLDVGCGTGSLAVMLAANGNEVVGVDPQQRRWTSR